jgi:CMP-N-acetylneuraminic acid synthetase
LPQTISECADALRSGDANCCFAARPVSEPPDWMFVVHNDGTATPLLGKRIDGDAIHMQKLARPVFPAGAAYAVRTEILRREKTLFVEPMRVALIDPLRAIDVDEEIDLMLADLAARRYGFSVFGSKV